MAAELKNPGPIEYDAVIKSERMHQTGLATWVEFDHDLKETYGKGNLIPVIITFDGQVRYQGSLAKMGPKPIILLRKDKREELGKGPGDKIHVKVELDTAERKIQLDADETQALKSAGLLEKFQKLAFTHQREYHQWITEAKRPETRTGRISQMIEQLDSPPKK